MVQSDNVNPVTITSLIEQRFAAILGPEIERCLKIESEAGCSPAYSDGISRLEWVAYIRQGASAAGNAHSDQGYEKHLITVCANAIQAIQASRRKRKENQCL